MRRRNPFFSPPAIQYSSWAPRQGEWARAINPPAGGPRSKKCQAGDHDFDPATGACKRKGCPATLTRTMFPMTRAEQEQAYGFDPERSSRGFKPGDPQRGLFNPYTYPPGHAYEGMTEEDVEESRRRREALLGSMGELGEYQLNPFRRNPEKKPPWGWPEKKPPRFLAGDPVELRGWKTWETRPRKARAPRFRGHVLGHHRGSLWRVVRDDGKIVFWHQDHMHPLWTTRGRARSAEPNPPARKREWKRGDLVQNVRGEAGRVICSTGRAGLWDVELQDGRVVLWSEASIRPASSPAWGWSRAINPEGRTNPPAKGYWSEKKAKPGWVKVYSRGTIPSSVKKAPHVKALWAGIKRQYAGKKADQVFYAKLRRLWFSPAVAAKLPQPEPAKGKRRKKPSGKITQGTFGTFEGGTWKKASSLKKSQKIPVRFGNKVYMLSLGTFLKGDAAVKAAIKKLA